MSVSYVNLAAVRGIVTDVAGAPISGATVRIGSVAAKTDDQGAYLMDEVEVGTKSATVMAAGYQAVNQEVDVRNLGDEANVFDFKLEKKAEIDLSKYQTIESDKMKVYVSQTFPQPVRYELKGDLAGQVLPRPGERPVQAQDQRQGDRAQGDEQARGRHRANLRARHRSRRGHGRRRERDRRAQGRGHHPFLEGDQDRKGGTAPPFLSRSTCPA